MEEYFIRLQYEYCEDFVCKSIDVLHLTNLGQIWTWGNCPQKVYIYFQGMSGGFWGVA